MWLRMKNLTFLGFTEKSDFGGGGGHDKNPIYRLDSLKGGLGRFSKLRGVLNKKEGGGVFEGGLKFDYFQILLLQRDSF